MYLTQLFPARQ